MIRNGTLINKGISKLNYYDPIPRTSDLLRKSSAHCGNGDLLISNYYIAPSNLRYDDLVEEILFELNGVLGDKFELPAGKEIVTESIKSIIKKYHKSSDDKDAIEHAFKDWLQKNKYTGELIKVASSLNSSTMDPFARAVLSEENIFMYLAYRTISGNEIKDAKGIAANILDSLGIVKSFINTSLVPKVIEEENLDVSKSERAKLNEMVKNKPICYFPGDPVKTIVKLIDHLKDGGYLIGLVKKFLDSGKVDLPRNADKAAIAKKMVANILKKGYLLGSDPSIPVEPVPDPKIPIPPDNFEIIENVGPETSKKFVNAGIITFAQLASYEVEDLFEMLKEPRIHIKYDTIIEQARIIASGDLKKLVKYQDELNKRKP